MPDFISLTGFVATPPKSLTTSEGLAITSFRLASNQRRFDRATEKWVDAETNWYTITTFRGLATNAAMSVHQGDRVVVSGKLRVREYQAGDKKGVSVEVDADALGHDLTWGTAAFSRNAGATTAPALPSAGGWATADIPAGNGELPTEPDAAGTPELVGAAASGSPDIETPF